MYMTLGLQPQTSCQFETKESEVNLKMLKLSIHQFFFFFKFDELESFFSNTF